MSIQSVVILVSEEARDKNLVSLFVRGDRAQTTKLFDKLSTYISPCSSSIRLEK